MKARASASTINPTLQIMPSVQKVPLGALLWNVAMPPGNRVAIVLLRTMTLHAMPETATLFAS
jgi:hypothetical protein